MLNSLYILGTDTTLAKGRKYMKIEIERYRVAIGSCLGAFASTFPIAFLESSLNKNNPCSLVNKMQDQSLQAQGKFEYYSFQCTLKDNHLTFVQM